MATSRTGQTTDYGSQTQTKATDYQDSYSVPPEKVDGAELQGTRYTPDFDRWHGYYRRIPELRAVVNKFASWTFGKGITADEANKTKLDKIKGNGKDSARSVLKNQWRTALICGDSFAHIIPGGNLKPLNPGKMVIVANAEGIITSYEHKDRKEPFTVNEIYHLSYERIADENHGIPFPEALEDLIKARNEGIEDLRILYHRNIKPIQFFEAETDDETKLQSIENTINEAYKKSENVVIAAGVIKEIKKTSIPQYGNLDSLSYIKFLVRQFVTSCGMPEVVMGWGAETTEASSNIILVSYEQEIWDMKLYNQDQVESQLKIKITIKPAPSLMDKLQKDKGKDGPPKAEQPQPGKDT